MTGGFATPGLGAVGTGGFAPPTAGGLGAPGLLVKGGGAGLGFEPTGGGGGFPASELPGRELAGVTWLDGAGDFFHGVAEPFEGAIPGKTATGFADAFAVTGFGTILGAAGAAGAAGILGPPPPAGGGGGGGGGGGAAAAFGFGLGGTSSR